MEGGYEQKVKGGTFVKRVSTLYYTIMAYIVGHANVEISTLNH